MEIINKSFHYIIYLMESEEWFIKGNKYIVNILTQRKKTSTVRIKDNIVTIQLSAYASVEKKERHLKDFREWAMKRIEKDPDRFKPPFERVYKDRDILKIGSEKYALRIDYSDRKTASSKVTGNIIKFNIPSNIDEKLRKKCVSSLLARTIASRRLPSLHDKVNLLNNMFFQKNLKEIKFKNMKSQWGNCSRDGKITISTRLLFAPEEILEYVCVHELAHLVHFNHSKKFWSLVEKVMPDYKERDKWLSKNGEKCVF